MLLLGFNHFYRNKSKSSYSTQERSNNYKLALGYETQGLMFVASIQLSRQIIFETVFTVISFQEQRVISLLGWINARVYLNKFLVRGEQLLILEGSENGTK